MVYRLLADSILIAHAAFVAFVILGLVVTWLGALLGWRWVHLRWFRLTHLAAIGFVVVQTWLGRMCPLTVWENELRRRGGQAGYDDGFIAYWLHQVIFYDLPAWVFLAAYTLFALLVAGSLWLVPVQWRSRR